MIYAGPRLKWQVISELTLSNFQAVLNEQDKNGWTVAQMFQHIMGVTPIYTIIFCKNRNWDE